MNNFKNTYLKKKSKFIFFRWPIEEAGFFREPLSHHENIPTVKPVLVVTSIKQPTCIKQPEESCPKIQRHIYLNCIKQPPAFSSHILSFPWVGNFQFFVVKFSIYMNRPVFVMMLKIDSGKTKSIYSARKHAYIILTPLNPTLLQ